MVSLWAKTSREPNAVSYGGQSWDSMWVNWRPWAAWSSSTLTSWAAMASAKVVSTTRSPVRTVVTNGRTTSARSDRTAGLG